MPCSATAWHNALECFREVLGSFHCSFHGWPRMIEGRSLPKLKEVLLLGVSREPFRCAFRVPLFESCVEVCVKVRLTNSDMSADVQRAQTSIGYLLKHRALGHAQMLADLFHRENFLG